MFLRPLTLLVFSCLALPACNQKTEETALPASLVPTAEAAPVTGDWLLDHYLSDPENLNPITSNDAGASGILSHIFEGLMFRDPRTLELQPLIAEAPPEVSEDKLQYTYRIRQDVTFQDGLPLTGEDVLFSIKVIKNPAVNAPFIRVYYASIVNVELLDPFTIRFTAKEPYFLNETMLGGFDILPRHYYDPEGFLDSLTVGELDGDWSAKKQKVQAFADTFNKDFNRNPMGSGPYKFSSWKTGQEVILHRNTAYWGEGKPGIPQVYLDQFRFRIINNMDAALVSLKSGQLDLMGMDPLQFTRQTDTAKFKENFKKKAYFSPGYTYIGWNNNHPIFKDKRVRNAMTYFVDRQQIITTILFGLGQIVDSPIYRFRPEYDETLFSHPFDPQKGLALLTEAGWSDSDGDGILDKVIDGKKMDFKFELKINSGNEKRKGIALSTQDELKKHGIVCRVRELDWTIFLDHIKNHKFDAMILGWSMSVNPPDAFQIWHSSQSVKKGSNHISFKSSEVDKILEEYRREFDPEKRTKMYKRFQKILNEEQPYTFLYMPKSAVAYHKRFSNVEVLPIGGFKPDEWWVPPPLQKYKS